MGADEIAMLMNEMHKIRGDISFAEMRQIVDLFQSAGFVKQSVGIVNNATTTEKQIEEMAKILCGMKNGCDRCMWDKVYCNERNYAEEIYNAGYRKQSEGEWVTVGSGITERVVCSNCGSEKGYFMRPPFCNQCGAKMKGGEE